MNHMEPIYIRTDKNGTKIFHDWKCPRCGGAGMCDKWIMTGRVCFSCGGTGKRTSPKIIKEYTPEYWAKLEARRQAKSAKEEEARKQYEEEHADEIAAKRAAENQRIFELRCSENGCGKDGIGFVLTGNTFPVKDQIKNRRPLDVWLLGMPDRNQREWNHGEADRYFQPYQYRDADMER